MTETRDRLAAVQRTSLPTKLCACLFVVALAVTEGGCGPAGYSVVRNISYDGTSTSPTRTLDLYTPENGSPGPRPLLIGIHGGFWATGDKAQLEELAGELCRSGYSVASVNYELATATGGTWPAQLEDCRMALRFLRQNAARLGIDADRMASIGISAGAQLATMLCLRDDVADVTSNRVPIAVDIAGEQDMFLGTECMTDFEAIMTRVLGHGPPYDDAFLRDISPVTYARKDASVLIVHGESDPNVFVVNAERLYSVLTAKGADVEYLKLVGSAGAEHSQVWKDPDALARIRGFLATRFAR